MSIRAMSNAPSRPEVFPERNQPSNDDLIAVLIARLSEWLDWKRVDEYIEAEASKRDKGLSRGAPRAGGDAGTQAQGQEQARSRRRLSARQLRAAPNRATLRACRCDMRWL